MPKRSNEFQNLIFILQQQLVPDARVTESMMLRDYATGDEREVDIVIETPFKDKTLRVCIECCDRSRKADVEWIEQMWAKHQDLPTDSLVLAARAGYTKGARLKAAVHQIEIADYSEVITADWSNILKLWKDIFLVNMAIGYSYSVVGLTEDQNEIRIDFTGDEIITDKETRKIFTVGNVIEQLLEMHDFEQKIVDATPLDKGKGFELVFDAPLNRYTIMISSQFIVLQRIIVVARAQKAGTHAPLQHGAIGTTRFAYGKGTSFGSGYIVSLAEPAGDDVRAILQLHNAHGRKQSIILTPSEALTEKMRELRESE